MFKGSLAVIAATVGLTMMCLPAGALSGSGSGGVGTLFTDLALVSHPQPDCASANDGFGATTTFSSATVGAYSGGATIDWAVDQTNGPWYEGPDATYGNYNAACGTGHSGAAWEITGSVSGTNGANSVSCSSLSGTYSRTNDVDVVVSLSGSCSVNGGGASATTFSVTTTLGTCYDNEPPAFIPETCDTTDSYSAT